MIVKLRSGGEWHTFEADRVGITTGDHANLVGLIQQGNQDGKETYLIAMAGEKDLDSVMRMIEQGGGEPRQITIQGEKDGR